MTKLVYDIGFNDKRYPAKVNNKTIDKYTLWVNMLYRCTEKLWIKHPTYTGTTCSENFKSYSFFYEWCNQQLNANEKDENGKSWHLDKDLLSSKMYSEDTCVFIPQRINKLLTKSDSARGKSPIGVCWHKPTEKYQANCQEDSEKRYLGLFNTAQEAFIAYRDCKESFIKKLANEYKSQLDPRAYQALMNYQVEITD